MIPSTIDPDHLVTTLRDMRSPLAIAAADEIESLRAQLAKATAVLEEILFGEDIDEMRRAAGIALRQVQK